MQRGGDANHIRILQALSTFFVGEQPPSPGGSYPLISIRCLASFLNLDVGFVQDVLPSLSAHGFLELTKFEARLTPSRWALNTSRYASYLSYYVGNAPYNLRGSYAQAPINPQRCYNPQPELHGQNTTVASNFNGVYSSSQTRGHCEGASQGPFELIPSYHGLSFPAATVAENLNFLVSSTKALFRGFLSSLWQQGIKEETAYGPATLLLTQYVDQTTCLVAAPCDDLGIHFNSPAVRWLPHSFIAPVCGLSSETFASTSSFPLSFPSLSGGLIVLHFSGVAEVTGSDGEALRCVYQLVGPAKGGSFLVSLINASPSTPCPQVADHCPI